MSLTRRHAQSHTIGSRSSLKGCSASTRIQSEPARTSLTSTEHCLQRSDAAKFYYDDILGHEEKNGHYKFKVRWNTGEQTKEPAKYLREDAPKDFAEYLRRTKLSELPQFEWSKEIDQQKSNAELNDFQHPHATPSGGATHPIHLYSPVEMNHWSGNLKKKQCSTLERHDVTINTYYK